MSSIPRRKGIKVPRKRDCRDLDGKDGRWREEGGKEWGLGTNSSPFILPVTLSASRHLCPVPWLSYSVSVLTIAPKSASGTLSDLPISIQDPTYRGHSGTLGQIIPVISHQNGSDPLLRDLLPFLGRNVFLILDSLWSDHTLRSKAVRRFRVRMDPK